ncbi:MAG: peptide chain release factor 2 [Deferribacteres bacterium]|nr:peptide chain release factor 2 [candidate division KSB1 bacterium]MCB9511651.1 peptide chain release factor 2 [Deferribacteres bacterium]
MIIDIKEKLKEYLPRIENLRGCLDIEKRRNEIANLEKKSTEPGFWDDQAEAQKVMREISSRKTWVDAFDKVARSAEDVQVMIEMAEEEDDSDIAREAENDAEKLCAAVEDLEFRNMLSGESDQKNAILTIHPGAGGTESQDWAQMLYRMYLRWIERAGFKAEILDLQYGDEAGIKDVSIEVVGDYAYGYLKAEAGVHRLVRISPFDANSRRHTSFASVFVYPEVDDDIEIEIDEKDLRVDTYRASGAGGQHVNKTSSAVRITHMPTNIVVQCQNERSQHRNRDACMKMLRARLYQLKLEEEQAKMSELEKDKKDISWGSQIRSYVFHPYNMVKDHRTGIETGNIVAVMDGDLDDFIKGFLMGVRSEKAKKQMQA